MTNPPPKHYPDGTFQPWNVIDAWGLNFNLGNVAKYLARAGKKGPALDDLVKARNYLDREIDKLANEVLNRPASGCPNVGCTIPGKHTHLSGGPYRAMPCR